MTQVQSPSMEAVRALRIQPHITLPFTAAATGRSTSSMHPKDRLSMLDPAATLPSCTPALLVEQAMHIIQHARCTATKPLNNNQMGFTFRDSAGDKSDIDAHQLLAGGLQMASVHHVARCTSSVTWGNLVTGGFRENGSQQCAFVCCGGRAEMNPCGCKAVHHTHAREDTFHDASHGTIHSARESCRHSAQSRAW